MPNGIIASLPDNSETSSYDPWLIYNPADTYEFPSNYGKLKDIIDTESGAILARFSDISVLYNKVDSRVDMGTATTSSSVNGKELFYRRPVTSASAKLGYGGTQNFASISCEAGHFWADAKRGQVLMVPPNGAGLEEISTAIGGKPSGMRNWFKEQLPFKILKYLPNVDVDNPYNGVGLTMGWDSRHRRVFLTKKDYIPGPCVEFIEGRGFVYNQTVCPDPQIVPNCPIGFAYNSETKFCEKIVRIPAVCTPQPTYRCFQSYTSIENFWANDVYTLQLNNLILDGVEYASGQTIVINSTGDLVVGIGIDGVTTYVQNINNWINSITGVVGSGFIFYDDMSTVDCPTEDSTFTINITRVMSLVPLPMNYWWTKNHGLSIISTGQPNIPPISGFGAYNCTPI